MTTRPAPGTGIVRPAACPPRGTRRDGTRPPRPGLAALGAAALAIALLAGCQQLSPATPETHAEAWQVDIPARFSFPPVGLEEFALDRRTPASLELVIRIGADGRLEEVGATHVEGLDAEALETLFATIRRARFEPARTNDVPVASIKRVALSFDPAAGRLLTAAEAAPYGPR